MKNLTVLFLLSCLLSGIGPFTATSHPFYNLLPWKVLHSLLTSPHFQTVSVGAAPQENHSFGFGSMHPSGVKVQDTVPSGAKRFRGTKARVGPPNVVVASPGVIVLLSIGQSNAVSRAHADPDNEVPPTLGTYWFRSSDSTLLPCTDPIGEDVSRATERSFAPMLSKKLKELSGKDIIIVHAPVGNTFIASWQKSAGYYYQRAKAMLDAALRYCRRNNITVAHRYVHWLQGENDAGTTETDDYYVQLNQFVNDWVSDGIEKVFATRIGYDPNYTDSMGSENIMKAQKILNYNNPDFVMVSYAPAAFTYANQKLAGDLTHYTLAGENVVGQEAAVGIQQYMANGTKPLLTENVSRLQPVTDGTINLIPDWLFNFSGNLNEENGNATAKYGVRAYQALPALNYADGGLVFSGVGGVTISRMFSSAAFTIEMRLKVSATEQSARLLTDGDGGSNIVSLEYGPSFSYLSVTVMGQTFAFNFAGGTDLSVYHVIKLTQSGGVLKCYIDGVQAGIDQSSANTFRFRYVGWGGSAATDFKGTMDYLSVQNN